MTNTTQNILTPLIIAIFVLALSTSLPGNSMELKDKKVNAKINTLFYWCKDVSKMKAFYTDILGLKETFYKNDDQVGWLTYQVNGVQVVFMRGTEKHEIEKRWAKQPAWTAGETESPSLVIEYSDEEFQEVLKRAKEKGAKIHEKGFREENNKFKMHFLQDPMGLTIEIYFQESKNT